MKPGTPVKYAPSSHFTGQARNQYKDSSKLNSNETIKPELKYCKHEYQHYWKIDWRIRHVKVK